MKEYTRRDVLKGIASLAIGVGAGEAFYPIKSLANVKASEITGLHAGNASVRQEVESQCEDAQDPELCAQTFQFSYAEKQYGIFIGPAIEEAVFRAAPAWILSIAEESNNPQLEVLVGKWNFQISRGDFLVGLLSSLYFGFIHNCTTTGVDLRTIPASQIIGGIEYWILQRKFGFFSNTLAHMWNNYKSFR